MALLFFDLQQLYKFTVYNFTVPKCIKPANFGPTELAQLHHFADVSGNGYCGMTSSCWRTKRVTKKKYFQWQNILLKHKLCNQNAQFKTLIVTNRLAVIQEKTSLNQWKYTNTMLNPADDASRGMRAETFLWWWKWLKRPNDFGEIANDDVEVKEPDADAVDYCSKCYQLRRAVCSWSEIMAMLHRDAHQLFLLHPFFKGVCYVANENQ